MERPGALARTRTTQNTLHTLVRTRRGFVVFDPRIVEGTRWSVDDHGTLVDDRVPAGATLALVGASGIVAGLLVGDGWWRLASLSAGLLAGAVLAALLLWLLHLVAGPERSHRAATGSRVYSRTVTDTSDPATWQLCVLATRVAGSRAFRAGLVDPQRQLGHLLWSAVGPDGPADPREARDVLRRLAEASAEFDIAGPAPAVADAAAEEAAETVAHTGPAVPGTPVTLPGDVARERPGSSPGEDFRPGPVIVAGATVRPTAPARAGISTDGKGAHR